VNGRNRRITADNENGALALLLLIASSRSQTGCRTACSRVYTETSDFRTRSTVASFGSGTMVKPSSRHISSMGLLSPAPNLPVHRCRIAASPRSAEPSRDRRWRGCARSQASGELSTRACGVKATFKCSRLVVSACSLSTRRGFVVFSLGAVLESMRAAAYLRR